MSEAGRPQAFAGRAAASARIFPWPDPQMYTDVREGDLLSLTHALDGRRRPDARGRVARLLRSHRLALTAELGITGGHTILERLIRLTVWHVPNP